jgi:hypothetical protein
MRTKEEKEQIIQSYSDPFSLEGYIEQYRIEELIKDFKRSTNKIFKNTGPTTVNFDINHSKYTWLRDKVKHVLGNVDFTASFFFYTDKPHVIHNDDTYELPKVYKGITIPLQYLGGFSYPYLCFFHQYYLEGPAKFFKGGVNFPEFYNKNISDYKDVQGLSEQGISETVRLRYLSHLKPEWLEGLSFDRALPWIPGNMLVFDSTRLHCASNFLQQGIKSKLGISVFTKLSDDAVSEK